MALAFNRPVGAAIDVKELEYISALHQTAMPKLREDASIHDVDVKYFLKSRYGIEVSIEEVRSTVLKGLGGGDEDEECIDLSELVAIMLIPTLIKASSRVGVPRSSSVASSSSDLDEGVNKEADGEERLRTRDEFESNFEYKQYLREREISRKLRPPEGIIEDVLTIMVGEMGDRDVDGGAPSDGREGRGKRGVTPRLDEDLIRRLFLAHGELELAHDDDLVRQMVSCARGSHHADESGGETYFDAKAFARGLTSDVQNYHVENETKLTTNYYDVFKSDQHSQSADVVASGTTVDAGGVDALSGVDVDEESALVTSKSSTQDEEWDPNERTSSKRKQEKAEQGGKRRVRTFAAIDFVAETYRWKALVTLLWTGFILSFFAYRDEIHFAKTELECSYEMKSSDHELSFGYTFGCRVAQSIVNWLEIFAELCLLGLLYIGTGSLGNDIGSNRKCPIIIGIIFMTCFTVIPPIFSGINIDSDRDFYLYEELNYYMALSIGFATIALQLYLLLGRCLKSIVDRTTWSCCLAMTQFFVPGNVRAESMNKQAAAYKLNHMLKNARALHYNSSDDSLNVAADGEMGGTLVSSALLKFAKSGKKYIPMGGFLWTWKRIFTKELYTENGMWLSGRIMSGNASQLLISVFIIVFGITVTRNTEKNYNEKYQQVTSFIYSENTAFDGYVNATIQKVNDLFIEQITAPERTQKMREFVASQTMGIVEGSVQVSLDSVYSSIMDSVGSFNCSLDLGSLSDCDGNVTKAESGHERDRKRQHFNITERQTQEITNDAHNTTEGLDLVGTNEFTMNDTQSESDVVSRTNGTEIGVTNDVETTSTQGASGFVNGTGGPDICMALDMLPLCDIMETGEGIHGQFEGRTKDLLDSIQNRTQDSVLQLEDKLFRLILNRTQVVVQKATESYKPVSVLMITIPMYIATGVAFISMMYIVLTLIPSTSTTILMLRSGVIPTFRDPNFCKYRSNLHQMTLLLGFMFWGGLLSSALVGVVIGFVVFLFVYQVTRVYMWNFVAGAIGVAVSILAKAIIFQIFKFFFYGRAFYRKRPAASNLASLGLECTNIGSSVLFVIIRMAKVIAISLIYIGRIDTPLLAHGVGSFGAVELDNANTIFRKTILAHEAHRHPYIETLGVMYLMKLHYGSRFATTSGSCWRLLFVLTLMPWLRKYRVMARPALEPEDEESSCHGESNQTARDPACSRTKTDAESINMKLLTAMEEENADLQNEIKRLKEEINALRSESQESFRDDEETHASARSLAEHHEPGQDDLGEEGVQMLSNVQ